MNIESGIKVFKMYEIGCVEMEECKAKRESYYIDYGNEKLFFVPQNTWEGED